MWVVRLTRKRNNTVSHDSFQEHSVTELTDALASREPTPGGGVASATAAAVAVALGEMVTRLTANKKGYENAQEVLREYLPKLEAIRARLLELADEDGKAFIPLSKAYKLPRKTEEEKAYRNSVLEEALRRACEPPEYMMETICEAIDIVDDLTRIGSTMLMSDVGAAATLLSSALRAACLNVFINARSMKDTDYATGLVSRTQSMLEDGCNKADAAYTRVERGIRWRKN